APIKTILGSIGSTQSLLSESCPLSLHKSAFEGGRYSFTRMVKEHEDVLPLPSLASNVSVVRPIGNSSPDCSPVASVCVITTLAVQLSVAVTLKFTVP